VLILSEGNDIDLNAIIQQLLSKLDDFNRRGSGWQLGLIKNCTVSTAKYRPLVGSSYIPTPSIIANKHAVVNVKNFNDNLCFVWSVLAQLHPAEHNPDRLTNYERYLGEINVNGLEFPLSVKHIPKFESLNPTIRITVLAFDEDEKDFIPLYTSPYFDRQHHVNLLLIANGDKKHYVLIRHMSRLVIGRTDHNAKTFVCEYCLHPCTSENFYNKHVLECSAHSPQRVVYPEEGSTLEWTGIAKTEPVQFVIYADFESFLVPGSDDKLKNAVDTHIPSGFCCFTVSKYEKYNNQPPKLYSGPDVMDHFYNHLIKEKERINEILQINEPMKPMTLQQQISHDSATSCITCHKPFTTENHKVRHHCHVTGEYIGPACNNCNLQLKPRHASSGSDWKTHTEHFIPVVLHNLKNYDSHIILKNFKRIAAEPDKKQVGYRDIHVIATNSERYISFEFNGLRFIDSFQFLPSSLDKLVSNCALDGHDKFVYMRRWLSDSPLLIAKGVYPYEYMTGKERFQETQLPQKEDFYSRLTDEHISDEDYDRAQQVWSLFECKTLQDYHDIYLMTDVLLLAQVFETFRSMALKNYGLDPAHYRTLPGFSWDALLKLSGVKLDLISDPEIYLFLENSIRGGIFTISNRYASANDPRLPTFDSTKPSSYITYLDVNNLYGHAMTQALPLGDFRFLSRDEIDRLDIDSLSDDASQGYIFEVDLSYPKELHKLHSDFPVAPQRVKVTADMLSPYCKSLAHDHVLTEKLVPNLYDKVKYVTHYRNLKLYKRLGLTITAVHRVLTFTQSPWMRSFIQLNTRLRQQAKSEFEKDFFKLMNNAVFGKSMENVRNRQNFHLVTYDLRAKKLIARPTFKSFDIINDDLVLIEMTRPRIKLNKPIYTGFCVLDLSKELMYSFYYDTIKKRYGDRSTLLFTDTDSLCLHIQTDDLYSDMLEDLDKYDTSNYDRDSPLYSTTNAKVVGKMKDECGGKPIAEFVGLRAKMYSLSIPGEPDKLTCKGVKKSYVAKNLRHSTFLETLTTQTSNVAEFYNFRSHLHTLHTVRIQKQCLSAFDDKRYILSDGFSTLAYGHCDIPSQI
jgi:hypothetical protein